jgi:CheY-like chemotaxis protein
VTARHVLSLALVADADPEQSGRLSRHLASCGWQSVEVRDGAGALGALCSEPISLALISLELPGMPGADVIRSARAAGWSEAVIFTTAREHPEARRACRELGALAFLVHPVPRQSVAEVLRLATKRLGPPVETDDDVDEALAELAAGTKVHLCIRSGPAVGSHSAAVVYAGRTSLSVSAESPDESGLYVSLGTAVCVGFSATRGWAEFEARVTGSCLRDSATEITLSRPERVIYRQRRRSPRLPVSLPVYAWPAAHADRAGAMVSGRTEDIGPSGLRAFFGGALPSDELIALAIDPGHGLGEVRLTGRPVWCQAFAGTGNALMHRYGFELVPPPRDMRLRMRALMEHLASGASSQ